MEESQRHNWLIVLIILSLVLTASSGSAEGPVSCGDFQKISDQSPDPPPVPETILRPVPSDGAADRRRLDEALRRNYGTSNHQEVCNLLMDKKVTEQKTDLMLQCFTSVRTKWSAAVCNRAAECLDANGDGVVNDDDGCVKKADEEPRQDSVSTYSPPGRTPPPPGPNLRTAANGNLVLECIVPGYDLTPASCAMDVNCSDCTKARTREPCSGAACEAPISDF